MVNILSNPTRRIATNSPSADCFSLPAMGGKNFDHFDDLICFDRGVEAIIFCLRSAFETPPKILLPTLFCGQTESTMRQHGLKTAFYPIDSEMNPQIEGLQEVIRIEKPDAVLVCDYFGWSASNFDELKDLFWREHLFSIRDCCHNPHSYNRGESDFDAVIFSWRKCYPVGFGGGLLWEKGNPNKEHEYQSAHSLQQLFSSGLRRWFVGAAKKFLPLALIGILKSRLSIRPKKFIDLRFAKPKIKNSLEMTNLLANKNIMYQTFVTRRRHADLLLKSINEFSSLKPCSVMDDQCCPQVLPLICKDAKNFYNFMIANGVEVVKWPGEDVPNAVLGNGNPVFQDTINRHSMIVCLPVHQDLSKKDLEKIQLFLRMWEQRSVEII